jgi:hypothetical protein
MGARSSAAVPVPPASDWIPYVAASGIVDSTDDEGAIHFIADILQSTPLPSQWALCTGKQGQRLFTNVRTQESTRRHPLEDVLRSLVDLYQKCAPLSQEHRDEMLSGVYQKWYAEAREENGRWRTVRTENGEEYYFNVATRHAIWEHPAELFLPGHYMQVRAIERLRSREFLEGLRGRALAARPCCSLEREEGYDESGPLEWRLNLDFLEAPGAVSSVTTPSLEPLETPGLDPVETPWASCV